MRIEGRKKLGFYPAMPEIVAGVLARLRRPTSLVGETPPVALLDPCCGEGGVLARFAEATPGLTVAGVELDAGRFRRAAERLPGARVLHSAYEDVHIPSKAFSLLWLNPPYDTETGGGRRSETLFLEDLKDCLVPGGVLVYLVPGAALARAGWILASHFHQVRVYLGDSAWNQVVVIAKHGAPGHAEQSDTLDLLDCLGSACLKRRPVAELRVPPLDAADGCEWSVPKADFDPADFKCRKVDFDRLEDAILGSGLIGTVSTALCRTTRNGKVRPVTPLRQAHLANLLMMGGINGEIGEGDRRHVIWGSIQKIEEVHHEFDGEEEIEIRRQVPRTLISVAEFASGHVYDLESSNLH